ncbi:MAG: hypothetical protein FJ087_11410 [Deltaproteobacteria bacterium]|nr:hypothetical protein [Deltaproteobacteria bacterium]
MERARVLIAGALSIASCAVVSPPPVLALHEPVLHPEPGAVSVVASGGGGGGVFTREFAGGTGGIGYQATRTVAVGLAGGGGKAIAADGGDELTLIGFGRAHVSVRPEAARWVAFRAGLGGGGADSGLGYLTGDLGLSFGHTFADRVRIYGGPAFAVSAPFREGEALAHDSLESPRHPGLTLYGLGVVGVAVRLVDRLDLSVEAAGAWGGDGESDSITAGAVIGGLRWTTGGLAGKRVD